MENLVVAGLALLVVVVSLLAVLVWQLVVQGRRPTQGPVTTDVVPYSGANENESSLPDVRVEQSDDRHAVLWANDIELATVSIDPPVKGSDVVPASVATAAVIMELTRSVPDLFRRSIDSPGWTVTFTKDVLRGLSDGSIKLMSGGQAVAVDAATSRVVEIGTVAVPGAARKAVASPAAIAGGFALAAALVQQQQIGAALVEVNKGIDRLYQRQIDDASGILHGGAEVAREVIAASQLGPIPDQIARELAVARRQVDAVYFGRREQIRRFIEAVEHAQNEHEERTGESAAWSPLVEAAFEDPTQFHADALAFVQAAAIKAHLAAGTVAVLANEGQADYAFGLLSRTEELLRADVFDLRRRLAPLASFEPEGRRRGKQRQEAHEIAKRLIDELEHHIEPLLPLRPTDTISVFLEPGTTRALALPSD